MSHRTQVATSIGRRGGRPADDRGATTKLNIQSQTSEDPGRDDMVASDRVTRGPAKVQGLGKKQKETK